MNNFKETLKNILTLTLTLFFILGLIIVFVQFFAVITNNGDLAIGVSKALKDIAIKLSIATAFISLAVTTIEHSKKDKK